MPFESDFRSCHVCGSTTGEEGSLMGLAGCSGCQTRVYCGLAHQKQDWKAGHREECKSMAEFEFLLNKSLEKNPKARGMALHNQGLAYSQGRGVEQSDKLALQCWRMADACGCREAATNLGCAYGDGVYGCEQDWAKAHFYFERGAKLGDSLAMFNLGMRHLQGQGVPRNSAKGVDWLRQAAALDHFDALCVLGPMLWTGGKGVAPSQLEACAIFGKAANMGDLASIRFYANCLRDGPCPRNLPLAFEYHKKGAAAGDLDCITAVGTALSKGNGVPRDTVAALEWYRKAEAKGCSNAMSNIGNYYLEGRPPLPRDVSKAMAQYEKAAALNHPQACFNLSNHLMDTHPKRAVELMRRAAETEPLAQQEYGRMLMTGVPGALELDLDGSEMWMKRALATAKEGGGTIAGAEKHLETARKLCADGGAVFREFKREVKAVFGGSGGSGGGGGGASSKSGSSKGGEQPPQTPPEVASMSIKQLKEELKERGVSTLGMTERGELQAAVEVARK